MGALRRHGPLMESVRCGKPGSEEGGGRHGLWTAAGCSTVLGTTLGGREQWGDPGPLTSCVVLPWRVQPSHHEALPRRG